MTRSDDRIDDLVLLRLKDINTLSDMSYVMQTVEDAIKNINILKNERDELREAADVWKEAIRVVHTNSTEYAIDKVIAAANGERVVGVSGNAEDVAYNAAITHVIEAIKELRI